ncbi:MAG: aspartate-semialdehyde dehydrogenase [Pseudomonadota bacterium]
MTQKKYNIAIVGATGAVGQEMINILDERKFPVGDLFPLASENSLGKTVSFRGQDLRVDIPGEEVFKKTDIALFSAGNAISQEYAPIAAGCHAVVIDNSSAFRMEPDIPLVVPEVNPDEIKNYKNRGIIANPNCSTIQLVVVLNPLHQRYSLKRAVVATYQSTSGAGSEAMDELSAQTLALFSNKEIKNSVFKHRIAFNLIPQIDVFLADGSTKEEAKLVNETKKILGDKNILVTATAVRVPVFYSHSEAVNLEFNTKINIEEVRKILSNAPGVTVMDDPSNFEYPMPVFTSGKDDVYVGRIRRDETIANGLNLWVVADNLRKGAALNAVQIAERLIAEHL